MRIFSLLLLIGIASLSSHSSISAQEASGDSAFLDVKTTGYFIVDGGYISETEDVGLKKWKNEPYGGVIGGLRLTAKPGPWMTLTVNPELKGHNIFPISPGIQTGETKQKTRYDIYMEEAKASWSLGGSLSGRYALHFGYMIYKDNPDAHVFGDYLFRSMIYPALLFTKFDYPQAQIFGLRAQADFFQGRLRNDVFFLSETAHYPYYDFSLAYSGSYSLWNIWEIGIGINARSLIPVRPSRTAPAGPEGTGLIDNTYKFVPFQDSTVIKNAQGVVFKTIWVSRIPGTDSALVILRDSAGSDQPFRVKADGNGIAGMSSGRLGNPAMGDLTTGGVGDLYPELHGVNTHYSFAGTLLTCRNSLDLLPLIRKEHPLGRNAFKLYHEIAVLGWKNYPGFYENRNERVAYMFGVYLPTLDKLDFLTIEAEYFGNKNVPSYDMRAFENVPQPGTHKGEVETRWQNDARRRADDFKWAVAAKKSWRGWALVAQAGTDHMKLLNEEDNEVFDVMSRPSQWYAQVRFVGGIR